MQDPYKKVLELFNEREWIATRNLARESGITPEELVKKTVLLCLKDARDKPFEECRVQRRIMELFYGALGGE